MYLFSPVKWPFPKKIDSLANNNQAFTETNRPLTMADFGDIHTISPK